MTQVQVTINGRAYAVACDDGQEERIRALASYVDGKVRSFAQNNPQATEARLMVLASLVIADEFAEATEALRRQKRGAAPAGTAANGKDVAKDSGEAALAQGIDQLADRIDSIAQRLESGHI